MDKMIFDMNIHKELCSLGTYMEYDAIARAKEREAEIVEEMVVAGLVLGIFVIALFHC